MPSVPRDDANALQAFIAQLSPEGRAAFFDVYDMLSELGPRYLAEHPDEVRALAEQRDSERAEGDR